MRVVYLETQSYNRISQKYDMEKQIETIFEKKTILH